MLLLVTGASGIGKSTVRRILEPQVAPEVECVELADISRSLTVRNLAWRQQTTEVAVQRAVRLQREGRHLLICGDPVAAVEVVAAPSAVELEGVAFCLLDATPTAQAARLAGRGDDPALLVHHRAFADWMREQATDPTHMLSVVTTNGWPGARWGRIGGGIIGWSVHVIDTTTLDPAGAAESVLAWLRSILAGITPAIRVSDPPLD